MKNEKTKPPEALADEALDKVAGGGLMDNFYDPCNICSRRDETVKYFTVDYGDGSSGSMNLCSVCADSLRQTYKLY